MAKEIKLTGTRDEDGFITLKRVENKDSKTKTSKKQVVNPYKKGSKKYQM